MELCVLCNQTLQRGENIVVPTQKGLATLKWAINERGDTITINNGQAVHENCRRPYTNKRSISSYLKKKEEGTSAGVGQILICSANFRTKRKLPQSFTSEHGQKRSKPGRPVDKEKADAFLKVAEFLQFQQNEE